MRFFSKIPTPEIEKSNQVAIVSSTDTSSQNRVRADEKACGSIFIPV
jgi:hypothetical protein